MLAITEGQHAALAAQGTRAFEDRVLGHWARCYPGKVARMPEPEQRALIGLAVERARAHRVTAEADVCVFADLVLLFGRSFDDPKSGLPWAVRGLADLERPAAERMDEVWAQARLRADAVLPA